MENIKLYGIQLSDIQLFLNVAKYKNFTKTGEVMFMTQSGVSKRISQIEKELGLILFSRTKREVVLTPAGRILEERLSGVMTEILDAIASAHITQTGTTDVLRIAYLEWGNVIFIEKLKNFMNQNPQFDVNIKGHQFIDLHQALEEDHVDLVFTTSYDCSQLDKDIYNVFKVSKAQLMICINKNNPLAQKKEITIEDLEEEPILMLHYAASPGYAGYVTGLFKKHGVKPQIGQYANNGVEHLGNVMIDKGILFVSNFFPSYTQKNDVALIPVKDEYIFIVAASKKDNKSLVLSEFIKYILNTDVIGDGSD